MAQLCQRCTQYEATSQAVGLCVCQYCQVFLVAPQLPQLEDFYQGDTSKCCRCFTPFLNSYQCQNCGYVELALCGDALPEPVQQAIIPQSWPQQESKCWTCGNCNYEYNLLSAGICTRCSHPNATNFQPAQAYAPMPLVTGNSTDAYYGVNPGMVSEVPWRCQYCGQGEGQCVCSSWTTSEYSTWKCQNCEKENSSQEAMCRHCQLVPGTKCGLCGQECEGDLCQNCVARQVAPHAEEEAKLSSSPPQEPPPSSPVPQVAVAPKARSEGPAQHRAPAHKPAPLQATYWTCKSCSRKNEQLTIKCFCGGYQHWTDYFKDKSIKLSEDQKMWICKKCGTQVSLRECSCSACGKENKDVKSFIHAKGDSKCHIF